MLKFGGAEICTARVIFCPYPAPTWIRTCWRHVGAIFLHTKLVVLWEQSERVLALITVSSQSFLWGIFWSWFTSTTTLRGNSWGQNSTERSCFCFSGTLKFPAINIGRERAVNVFLLSSDPNTKLEHVQRAGIHDHRAPDGFREEQPWNWWDFKIHVSITR